MASRQFQRLVEMEAGFKSPLSPLYERGEPFDNDPLMCSPLLQRGVGGYFSAPNPPAMAS